MLLAGESGVTALDAAMAREEPWRNPAPGSAADEAALERGQFRRDWVGRVSYVIFSRRKLLLIVFVLVTIALAAMASQLRVQAGFTKMIPLHHPYMATFL